MLIIYYIINAFVINHVNMFLLYYSAALAASEVNTRYFFIKLKVTIEHTVSELARIMDVTGSVDRKQMS